MNNARINTILELFLKSNQLNQPDKLNILNEEVLKQFNYLDTYSNSGAQHFQIIPQFFVYGNIKSGNSEIWLSNFHWKSMTKYTEIIDVKKKQLCSVWI